MTLFDDRRPCVHGLDEQHLWDRPDGSGLGGPGYECPGGRAVTSDRGAWTRQAWCFVNGLPDYACPDHAMHLARDEANDTGRTGFIWFITEGETTAALGLGDNDES